MIKKIKRIIAGTLAASLLSLGVFPALALAQPDIQNSTCQGSTLQFGSDTTCEDTAESEEGVNDLIATVINIFSVIVGIVAVIMIIYGGFRYITSGGDSSKITDAKNTILYAIVGLIIVALAQFIVKFVLAKATGQDA
ncbi:MAG TPA: pilin [Patescibacteria group bacterium]|nr:pilin [Patescibacteria group bacterium]